MLSRSVKHVLRKSIISILTLLLGVIVISTGASDADSLEVFPRTENNPTESSNGSHAALCKRLYEWNEEDRFWRDHRLKWNEIPGSPGTVCYIGLDIDRDGTVDSVRVDSGSGESLLQIGLSTGGRYELDVNGKMLLFSYNQKIFVLVNYWDTSTTDWKSISRALYELNKAGAEFICTTTNERRLYGNPLQ